VEHPYLVNTNAFFVSGGGLQRLFLALLLVLFPLALTAQDADTGAIAGRVVDTWQGSPLGGVTVLVRGTTLGTTTDAAGNYAVANVPPGTYAVVFSRSGYSKATMSNVRVVAGQRTPADYALKPEFYEMETFEAVAEPVLDQGVNIMIERQKDVVMVDALGSDMLSKLGVSDAAEALTKVTGASIVDGKFAVIRGLSDRYTSATLNSMEIPSADPYRKSAQLDLFPSSMIERIEVNKTFTPDQPGGFTGGSVNIVTKTIPDKFFFKFSAGLSYNTQSSNQEILTSPGGSTDWLGMDDGTRAIPDGLANNERIPTRTAANINPADSALLIQQTRSFNLKQMSPTKETAPLNHNFSYAGGDRFKVGEGEMGYYATLSYDRKYSGYENGTYERFTPIGVDVFRQKVKATQSKGVDEVSWGAAVGMGYRMGDANELSFTFLNTQTGENSAYRIEGLNDVDLTSRYEATTLQYTERNLRSFLFGGKHTFASLEDFELDWNVSYTTTSQEDPDLRVISALHSPAGTYFDNSIYPQQPSRFWRDLKENNINYRVDGTLPFENWTDEEGKIKFGMNTSLSSRDFKQTGFAYLSQNAFDAWVSSGGDFADLLYVMERELDGGNHRNFYIRRETPNLYQGAQTLTAGYGMIELPVHNKLKFIGGGRFETTDLSVESSGGAFFAAQASSSILQHDFLPALGLIYTPVTNVNLRVHYSETVARPTYREIANVATFDYIGGEILVGNPDLQLTAIKNYDFRAEWFPSPGNVFSIGAFYKELAKPIELFYTRLDGDESSYTNRPSATVVGWEAEARVNLGMLKEDLKNFTVGVNYAWIYSETALTPTEKIAKQSVESNISGTRPMYDQSPYILNADITYDNPRTKTTITLSYNRTGQRLAIANPLGPDVYERPGDSLDLSISQALNDHWKLRFSAKNLLDPAYERYLGPDKTRPYSSYTKGMQFGLSLSCSF